MRRSALGGRRSGRRAKMSKGKSRRSFSKHAAKTHKKNLPPNRNPMRGGIRL